MRLFTYTLVIACFIGISFQCHAQVAKRKSAVHLNEDSLRKNKNVVYKKAINVEESPLDSLHIRNGYLKFHNSPKGKIILYYYEDGAYQYYGTRILDASNVNNRIILQEGKYRLECEGTNIKREFQIIDKMITEIIL